MPKGRPKLGNPLTCYVCNQPFYKPPSHVSKWPARTCSRACAAVLRQRDRVERICQHCGAPFLARADQVAKGFGLYCSNRCNGKATHQRCNVTCRWCSKAFQKTHFEAARSKKHLCSTLCRVYWQRRYGSKKGVRAFSSEQKRLWLKQACERCGTSHSLELDHIIPRFAGGTADQTNAQTLCRKCNREKYWLEDALKFEHHITRDGAG